MSKYYYHGVLNRRKRSDLKYSINTIIRVLATGGIKSKRLLGIKENYGFNGLDYVCVCKKLPTCNLEKIDYNAFSLYIDNGCSLIVSDKIDAVKTEYIKSEEEYIIVNRLSSTPKRYSDLFDEYQVKDMIPNKDIIGIAIPFYSINKCIDSDKELVKKVKSLIGIAKSLGLDIVDSSSFLFPYDYEFKRNIIETKKQLMKIN